MVLESAATRRVRVVAELAILAALAVLATLAVLAIQGCQSANTATPRGLAISGVGRWHSAGTCRETPFISPTGRSWHPWRPGPYAARPEVVPPDDLQTGASA